MRAEIPIQTKINKSQFRLFQDSFSGHLLWLCEILLMLTDGEEVSGLRILWCNNARRVGEGPSRGGENPSKLWNNFTRLTVTIFSLIAQNMPIINKFL